MNKIREYHLKQEKLKTELLNCMMENKVFTAKIFLLIKKFVGVLVWGLFHIKTSAVGNARNQCAKEDIVFISGIGCSSRFRIIWKPWKAFHSW